MSAENLTFNKYTTLVSNDELLERYQQAAVQFAGQVVIQALDPSNPDDGTAYAQLVHSKEARVHHPYWHDPLRPEPRTTEQILSEVVEPAERKNMHLVIIRYNTKDLSQFCQVFRSLRDE